MNMILVRLAAAGVLQQVTGFLARFVLNAGLPLCIVAEAHCGLSSDGTC